MHIHQALGAVHILRNAIWRSRQSLPIYCCNWATSKSFYEDLKWSIIIILLSSLQSKINYLLLLSYRRADKSTRRWQRWWELPRETAWCSWSCQPWWSGRSGGRRGCPASRTRSSLQRRAAESCSEDEVKTGLICLAGLSWLTLSSLPYFECIAVATASTWVTSGRLSGSGVMQSATTDLHHHH